MFWKNMADSRKRSVLWLVANAYLSCFWSMVRDGADIDRGDWVYWVLVALTALAVYQVIRYVKWLWKTFDHIDKARGIAEKIIAERRTHD